MTERRNQLSVVTQVTSQELPKHVHLTTARASTLEIKQRMRERSNPLSAVTQNHEPGASQTRSSHESTNLYVGDETNHDGTETPVVLRDASHEPGNEQSMLNEVNMDFRIPGFPHSVVKTSSELSCS